MKRAGFLQDPLLDEIEVAHGFGLREASPPAGNVRPKQVHGVVVARLEENGSLSSAEADAVISLVPDVPIAIVTADCVPILLSSSSGRAVAAVHAGWRGLAAGIVAAAARRLADVCEDSLVAAIGPHIRLCCYEVDAPVIDAMKARFGAAALSSLCPSREGHARIDLQQLVVADLAATGLAPSRISIAEAHCTACDADRFESFRRDGAKAGRLIHWIAASSRLA